MEDPFPRSRQALDADGFRSFWLGWLASGALAVAWLGWFLFVRVGVYAVSDAARLEVAQALQPIEAPVAGRIVSMDVGLGDEVAAGAPLFQIEAEVQRLQLERQRREGASSAAQREAVEEEIRVKTRALEQELAASQAALDEARASRAEAEDQAAFAEDQARRLDDLHARGLVSDVERLEARNLSRQRRAAAETRRLTAVRLESELRAKQDAGRAALAELERERARLAGDVDTSEASVERLEHELGQRVVRAPVAGRIASVADLGIGAVVDEGERLAGVVPDGEIKVVAEFAPPAALGRVRPGQTGRVRLEGFSWTHYGSLEGRVTRVGSEPRSGRVRVELELVDAARTTIPLQHGLPGSVEVEVERVTPATLVLRAAGRRLTGTPPQEARSAPPR